MKNPKGPVLVIGASGLLGHQVFLEAQRRYGRRAHGTFWRGRKALKHASHLHRINLMDPMSPLRLLNKIKPEGIINCAGIVRALASDPASTVFINGIFPQILKLYLDQHGGRLVQISTDCVFSGKKGNYKETDRPDPVDLYGKSKLLGEITTKPHLTLRTSFIGIELETNRGLLGWLLSQKGTVPGYKKAIWSGLTNLELARVILDLYEKKSVTGLMNVGGKPYSKYEILKTAVKAFGRDDIQVKADSSRRENRSLNTARFRRLGMNVPTLEQMLAEMAGKP